jgi:hypothetical protein
LAGIALASIGPVTSDTVRKLGLDVNIEAKESTIPGLMHAIREYFATPDRSGANDKVVTSLRKTRQSPQATQGTGSKG